MLIPIIELKSTTRSHQNGIHWRNLIACTLAKHIEIFNLLWN